MTKDSVLRLIHSRFGPYLKVGSEVRVNCPFCILRGQSPNTTKKLFINIEKHVYNCFRCEARGKLSLLFPQLEAVSIASTEIMNDIQKRDNELEDLPENLVSLTHLKYPWDELVWDFLSARYWTVNELKDKVYFCENYIKGKMDFGPRLVFPIYQFGTYRGFQARTIYKNTDPKYIGATNMDRKSILYNYDVAFSQTERLVITEGFMDQLRTGDQAVATLGKQITENQLRLIRLGGFKEVILFLDKDALTESTVNAKLLSKYFNTYVAIPTGKDPGEMAYDDIQTLLNTKKERVY